MNRMFWLKSVSLPAGRPAYGTLGHYPHFPDYDAERSILALAHLGIVCCQC